MTTPTPRSYKIAEKVQNLIESSGEVRLHATDIWQRVLKEEFESMERELAEATEKIKGLTQSNEFFEDGFVNATKQRNAALTLLDSDNTNKTLAVLESVHNEVCAENDQLRAEVSAFVNKGTCACCGEQKSLPIRNDNMGGYVCAGCVEKRMKSYQECAMELAVELVNYHEQWEREMGDGTVERSLALAKFNQLEKGSK